ARRLRSDHAAPGAVTEVQLEATMGGRRMRITRKPEQQRPKRRGGGTTTEQAKILLEEAVGDERPRGGLPDARALAGTGWRAVSTRVGEADDEIKDLMGMSAEQFYQVVLLPQGQFAQFLHADANDRQRLLQKLFGTDRFRAVEDWLADRRRTTARAVEEAEQDVKKIAARVAQVAGPAAPSRDPADPVPLPADPVPLPADPDALPDPAWAPRLAETAAAAAAACRAQVHARRAELDQAQDRQRGAERLADRQRRRTDALRMRDQLAQDAPRMEEVGQELSAALRGAEVTPALEEADRTTAALTAARCAESQARAAVPEAAQAGPQAAAADLRAAAHQHVTRCGRLDGLRSTEQQAADEEQAAASARIAAAALAGQIAAAERGAADQHERRLDLSRQRDQAREAAERLPGVKAEADRYQRAAADIAALAQARGDRSRYEEAFFAAKMEYLTFYEEASRLRRARIDGMRAELAAALVDGAPCPVCGSLDHPELCELRGERVTREQEEAADAEAAAASDRAETIGARLGAADERVADLSARLEEAGFTVAADPQSHEAEARRLAAAGQDLLAEAERLAAIRLPDLQAALDALDRTIAGAQLRLVELTDQHRTELRLAAEADQRAVRYRESLAAQLDGAPDLNAALARERAAAEALTAAADAADATARARAAADRAADLAAKAATEVGFQDPEAARQACRAAAWRTQADRDIRDHEAAARTVARLLADPDLDLPLDPPADVDGTTAAADAAREQLDEAVAAHDRAQHKAEQLADLAPQLTAKLGALQPLGDKADEARRLADLAAGQGANTLRMTLSAFVLAARLEEVAAAASERLLAMTSGRYSLIHTDTRRGAGRSGLGLLACDAWSGVDRDTSTLSGGETFLASLALALGLADVATAEAGGTRIEALFVDEGFGSLDEETLDEVMTVLDGLREGGRMVGIVSHVTELKQRIPAQIRVHKGHSGSHLTQYTGL
ncbi:MAG TPA: SbcC/MukB-like Walker B domain-containing protein, partial [Streptosporangiaceae bacterium]|nr:SbcC/MukB-like Walker B domain-containing protein [Streptosporangiaceae bacterium]